MDSHSYGSSDLISFILVLYFLRYIIWRFIELFLSKKEIIGVVSAKRAGYINLFHWVAIENNGSRIELNIGRAQVGLIATGDLLRLIYKGGRINEFEIVKSNYSMK